MLATERQTVGKRSAARLQFPCFNQSGFVYIYIYHICFYLPIKKHITCIHAQIWDSFTLLLAQRRIFFSAPALPPRCSVRGPEAFGVPYPLTSLTHEGGGIWMASSSTQVLQILASHRGFLIVVRGLAFASRTSTPKPRAWIPSRCKPCKPWVEVWSGREGDVNCHLLP